MAETAVAATGAAVGIERDAWFEAFRCELKIEAIARLPFLKESVSACARWRRARKISDSTAECETPSESAISA